MFLYRCLLLIISIIWTCALVQSQSNNVLGTCHNKGKATHNLTGDAGTITSSFRSNIQDRTTYFPSSECTWLIKPKTVQQQPKQTWTLVLDLILLETEKDVDTVSIFADSITTDWLTVEDFRWSGSMNNQSFEVSFESFVRVVFKSDYSACFDGFYINYHVKELPARPTSSCPYNCTTGVGVVKGTCINNSYCQCIDGVTGPACNNDDILRLKIFGQECVSTLQQLDEDQATHIDAIFNNSKPCNRSEDTYRIHCNDLDRVFGLDLSSLGLVCKNGIPELPIYLETLDASDNYLNNFQNSSFAGLKQLSSLILANCNISGTLPASMGYLTSLVYMDLSENALIGTIPSTFQRLTALTLGIFKANKLIGPIPTLWQYLTINALDLSGNRFWCDNPEYPSIDEFSCLDMLITGVDRSFVFSDSPVMLNLTGLNFPALNILEYPLFCLFGNSTAAASTRVLSSTGSDTSSNSSITCMSPILSPGKYELNLMYDGMKVSKGSAIRLQVVPNCTVGTYTEDKMACSAAPDGSVAIGQLNLPYSQKGFIKSNIKQNTFYPCIISSSCLGGENSTCDTGYMGFRCAECDKGYFSVGGGKCEICSKENAFIYQIIFFAALFLIAWIFLINTKNDWAFTALGILLFYAQVTSVLAGYDFEWSGSMEAYLNYYKVLDLDLSMFKLGCAFGFDFFSQYGFSLTIVPMVIGMQLILFGIRCLRDSLFFPNNKDFAGYWNDFIAASLSCLSFFHMPLANAAFRYVRCVEVEERTYLLHDPAVSCTSLQYQQNWYLAYIAIGCYAVGIPILFIIILTRNRRSVYVDATTHQRYADLCNVYRRKYMYWDCYTMFFNIMFTLFPIFLSQKKALMAFVVAVVLFFHATMLFLLRPFRFDPANSACGTVVGISIILVICGMIFQGKVTADVDLSRISLVMISIHLAAVVSIFYFFFHEIQYAFWLYWDNDGKSGIWAAFVRSRLYSWIFWNHAQTLDEIKNLHPHLVVQGDSDNHADGLVDNDKSSLKATRAAPFLAVGTNSVAPNQ